MHLPQRDTLGILNALILIACKGEECVGALDNRGIQRELGVAHHRAAGKELVRSFLGSRRRHRSAFSIGVPMRASRFFGSATAEPEMVTIRRMTGMPVVKRR